MDTVRKLVDARIKKIGKNYKEVSLAIEQNQTYIQQFIKYGKPERLPEDVRSRLAEFLQVDETALGAKLRNGDSDLSQPTDMFLMDEVDLRGGASPGGGVDTTAWQKITESGATVSAHKPAGTWGLPIGFARQELSLRTGHADVLPVDGPSMDDGTYYSLRPGDRVIIDTAHTDLGQGGIFALHDGTSVLIKQVELVRGKEPPEIVCKSLNPSYAPISLVLDETVRIIGRVAAKISRM